MTAENGVSAFTRADVTLVVGPGKAVWIDADPRLPLAAPDSPEDELFDALVRSIELRPEIPGTGPSRRNP
jgi:hypothetical protein